jgi:hypothetical protein
MKPSTFALISNYGYMGEHPDYPVSDWKTLVQIDEVRSGYWDWVEDRIRHEAGR